VRLPDLNILIYAVDEEAPNHDAALAWWNESLSGTETVGLAWTVLLGFVRLTSSPAVFRSPLTTDQAFDYLDRWLAQGVTTILEPTDRHVPIMRDLLSATGAAGNLVTDAHLAALAIEHGAHLYSADLDFGRFPRLKLVNPLA
jgi:toxin-antitoxin system PIN domain toxin